MFDTFHDLGNGFFFQTNLLGVGEADLREGVERLNGATGTKSWGNRASARADATR